MPGILPYLATSLLYGALAAYRRRALSAAGGFQPEVPGETAPGWEHFALMVPLLLHSALLYQATFSEDGMHLGAGIALSIVIWLTVLIYWLGNFFYRLSGLKMLVLPLAALLSLAPAVLPAGHPLPNTQAPAFTAHLVISLLAYGLFTIAALLALLMALLEKRLHGGALPASLRELPPLLTMETLVFRIIGAGFVLLTLSVASGILFSEELFGKPLQFNHKNLFALISWGVFAALLGGRQFYGWRGRVAMRWTLAGFLALLLAYLGSKFVLEVILGR